jgi:perosamine synthetase
VALIPQMAPWFDEHEAEAVRAYLLSGGWATEFRQTALFEQRLCAFTGAAHAVATCNGTISLSLALLALGVGPGDEVIVPDLTMIATANAARMIGATPVLVDVEPRTLNMDLQAVAAAAGPRTRAVIHVSLNGRSNDLDALVALCRARDLRLVEDAAQSLGSWNRGRHLGTIGDIGSFSFSAPKVISTGQGGALVTNDRVLAARLRKLKDFGRTSGGHDVHESLGFNFKFTDLQAVLGLEQMKKLPWRLQRKKEIWRAYRRGLAGVGGLEWVETDLADVSPWFIDVYLDDRDGLRAHLEHNEIGARPVYPPIHGQRAHGGGRGAFPVAERFSARGLWLPSSSRLSDDDVARVCEAVREFMSR